MERLGSIANEGESKAMETMPVSEKVVTEAGAKGRLLEACPVCGTLMDVTEQPPLEHVRCPRCRQLLQAHRQFNNYRLIALIGEGGMGSVFKARDLNLNREVALKILKRECSGSEEERAKLEEEARITASISHPHVIKVFSFGEDHGQFYLAMELAEKGSLDDLMGIQQRLAELQVLQIGIQIAEGLEAALERNLIHRDIKPGNILFSDPHTAKLVDFGLAIVIGQAAHARGEIWGTPYYIAPEKLDNKPEDFRSDIYSLGGTLFHALAGRPSYEAEAATTVALKQLISQSVSIQTFAPEVSGETAYVINRMLAKNPENRYASYRELIAHLSYARDKLLARPPKKARERIVLETQTSRNLSGLLTLGLLSLVVASGVLLYVFRDKFFSPSSPSALTSSQSVPYSEELFLRAIRMLAAGQTDTAIAAFDRLAILPEVAQPAKNWIRMNRALASLVAGNGKEAATCFSEIAKEGHYSLEGTEQLLANFFVEASKQLSLSNKRIPASIISLYSNKDFEAFGLLCFALHDWEIGALEDAGSILHNFLEADVQGSEEWIEDYKPLATDYAFDCDLVVSIEKGVRDASHPRSAPDLIKKIQNARRALRIGGRADARLQEIEQQLMVKGGNLAGL